MKVISKRWYRLYTDNEEGVTFGSAPLHTEGWSYHKFFQDFVYQDRYYTYRYKSNKKE